MKNFLTIDVEDYGWIFARDILQEQIPVSGRVVDSTRRLMDVLAEASAGAVFFCLGIVAREHQRLVREIHRRGFAVGSHGMNHLLYYRQAPAEIRRDLSESKAVLEDIIGERVAGFRAPQFNVSLERPEIIEHIIEAGYQYDSSIFPVQGRRYGSRHSPRQPYRIRVSSGTLVEFPLAAVEWYGRRFPAAGGGYLRHFPYRVTRLAIRSMNRHGIPATVYFHPYECDTERIRYAHSSLAIRNRIRAGLFNAHQYHNRSKTINKIRALIQDFSFIPIPEMLARVKLDELPEIDLAPNMP